MRNSRHDPSEVAVKIIAVIFAILFVFSTVAGVFLFNFNQMLLNPEIYKQTLVSENIYSRAPQLVAGQLAYHLTVNPKNQENSYQNLTQSDWEVILQPVITPDWVRGQTESAINQFFLFMNSDQPDLSIQISLADLKNSFRGPEGINTFLQVVNSQPACSANQLSVIQQKLEQGVKAGNLPICRPPEKYMNRFSAQLGRDMQQFGAALPGSVFITSRSLPNGSSFNSFTDLRRLYRLVQTLARFGFILPAVLLLLVTVFAVRNAHNWMIWWGVPLFIAGLLVLILSFAFVPLSSSVIYSALHRGPNSATPDLIGAILRVASAVARQVAIRTGIMGVVIAVIGGIMTAISPLVRGKSYA